MSDDVRRKVETSLRAAADAVRDAQCALTSVAEGEHVVYGRERRAEIDLAAAIARAERAEAQLAALREACRPALRVLDKLGVDEWAAFDTVIAYTAPAAEAHDRRVRAEVLAEASRRLRNVGARDPRARYRLAEAADVIDHQAESIAAGVITGAR